MSDDWLQTERLKNNYEADKAFMDKFFEEKEEKENNLKEEIELAELLGFRLPLSVYKEAYEDKLKLINPIRIVIPTLRNC